MNPTLQRALQILLPLLLLAAGYLIARHFLDNPPGVKKAPPPTAQATPVEVRKLDIADYQVVLRSHGTVEPLSRITLVPQVSGVVVATAAGFRDGGQFSAGEELVRIDDSDYRIAVRDAEAPLLKARAALAEEAARAAQAERDWKSLNGNVKASPLVLRTPQVDAARAEVLAAEARLARAQLDLKRTRLLAPFDGRVERTRADAGQYVPAGSELATLVATDTLQVRLPLTSEQLHYVDLFDGSGESKDWPRATVRVTVAGENWDYPAQITRSDAAIDPGTRQLFVVAEIAAPAANPAIGKPALKIGQFVEAGIGGRQLHGVFVIPRHLLLQGDEVLLALDGRLLRRQVNVVWRDAHDAVIGGGLSPGDLLVVTPLGNAVQGMRIKYPGSPS